eukprot:scaffold88703_cov29-Tisochrysis_lutea.AAC.1
MASLSSVTGHAYRRLVFYCWLGLWLAETIAHPSELQAMTLWLNFQLLLYFSISPSSTLEVLWLHTAVWGSMHSLGPGYLVMLAFISDSGSVVDGFEVLDAAQARRWCASADWCTNGTKSSFTAGASAFKGPFDCFPGWPLVRSFLWHFAPIILLHIDLRLNRRELAATHSKIKGIPARIYLNLLAPVWLALLHRDVVFPGAWTWKYHIPMERFASFDMFTNIVNIPAAFLSVFWLRRHLLAEAEASKRD